MNDDNWPFGFVGSLIVALIVFGIYCALDNASCKSRWERSGFDTSWGPIQGCLVKTPKGRWLPEDRVRDTDLTDSK